MINRYNHWWLRYWQFDLDDDIQIERRPGWRSAGPGTRELQNEAMFSSVQWMFQKIVFKTLSGVTVLLNSSIALRGNIPRRKTGPSECLIAGTNFQVCSGFSAERVEASFSGWRVLAFALSL